MHCYLGVASMHLLNPTILFGNSFLYRLNTESFVNGALDLSFVFLYIVVCNNSSFYPDLVVFISCFPVLGCPLSLLVLFLNLCSVALVLH